jgi:hypothetical protein
VRRVGHPKGEQPAEGEHGGDQRDQDVAQHVAAARLPRSWSRLSREAADDMSAPAQFPIGVFLRITSRAYLPRVQQRRRLGRRGRWSGAREA